MNNWENVLLRPTDSINTAIQSINLEKPKIVLIVDDSRILLGTVTDGDIRRALIDNYTLDDRLENIMFTRPTVATIGDSRSVIIAMMKSKGILQVPVVDDNRKVVGLETLQHLIELKKRDNPVFFMAGGFGKRLRPLTDSTPKPLLKVGHRPILETILLQFINSGFHKFYISTHYKANMIQEYFGDGRRWGVTIEYVNEVEPLGTAGALGLLPKEVTKLPLLVMNADLLTKVDVEQLISFHQDSGGVATMCVREYDFQVPYGVIKTRNHKVTSIEEKPVQKFFVNAGIYVLEPELVEEIDGDQYLDMTQLLEDNICRGAQVNSFPIYEYWLDVGQMKQLEKAQSDFLDVYHDL